MIAEVRIDATTSFEASGTVASVLALALTRVTSPSGSADALSGVAVALCTVLAVATQSTVGAVRTGRTGCKTRADVKLKRRGLLKEGIGYVDRI